MIAAFVSAPARMGTNCLLLIKPVADLELWVRGRLRTWVARGNLLVYRVVVNFQESMCAPLLRGPFRATIE